MAVKLNADNKARLAFAAVLLLAAVAAIGWYVFASSRHTICQLVTHDPVSGLLPDAPTEYHGVEVGKVKSVELIDSRSVRILLSIERSAPITGATAATITTRGLAARGFTGYVYVSLEDVGSDFSVLKPRPGEPYAFIPMAPAKSVSLDVAISRMDENVQFITDRVHQVLDDNTAASLRRSAANLERVTRTLADNSARLNALVVNSERASYELRPLLDSTSDTLRTLRTQILPETHRTLESLDELSSRLSGFAAQIDKDPSVIIRGALRPPPGPAEGR
jgi:phospholipid/cholesterol/gamma-HCH transport system substrate-binding protein